MRRSLARIAVFARVSVLSLAALGAAGALTASAQDDTADDTAEDRATSFQAVEGAAKEDVPGGPLLIAAYAVVLVLLVGYTARLGGLQAKTARELERLTRALEARGKQE
jgi:CcmD family protein